MSNIGRKVRLVNYENSPYSEYAGQIGVIIEDRINDVKVRMSDGNIRNPYYPKEGSITFEFLEEYTVEDIIGKKIVVHVPTKEICQKVEEVFRKNEKLNKRSTFTTEGSWDRYSKNTGLSIMRGFIQYSPTSYYKGEHYTIIKGEDFIIHNEHLLTTKKEETMSTEKPSRFIILGKPHQISAMMEDLRDLKYKIDVWSGSPKLSCVSIINNESSDRAYKTKENFSHLFIHHLNKYEGHSYSNNKRFNLPEQYSEALAFAKEQINHPYWTKKPESRTIIIGSKNVAVTVRQNGNVAFAAEGSAHSTDIDTVKLLVRYDKANKTIAGYDINIAHDVRFIRIGCERENNLFSINEIQKIVDTYNELNS